MLNFLMLNNIITTFQTCLIIFPVSLFLNNFYKVDLSIVQLSSSTFKVGNSESNTIPPPPPFLDLSRSLQHKTITSCSCDRWCESFTRWAQAHHCCRSSSSSPLCEISASSDHRRAVWTLSHALVNRCSDQQGGLWSFERVRVCRNLSRAMPGYKEHRGTRITATADLVPLQGYQERPFWHPHVWPTS